jgi:transposase, IS6 family
VLRGPAIPASALRRWLRLAGRIGLALVSKAYAHNRIEADHGQLKRRLRPMRGLKTDQSARFIIAGHAFIQNIRRGHYELGVDEPVTLRVVGTFDELALAI